MKRDLYYVAPAIKPAIVKKIAGYWILCLAFATLPLVIGRTMIQPDRFFLSHIADIAQAYWPMYVMFLGLLPFAVRDSMRVVNRTLGPLKRLKFELSQYRQTGKYHPVNARDDDYLHDLIQDIDAAILMHAQLSDKVEVPTETQAPQEELVESAV